MRRPRIISILVLFCFWWPSVAHAQDAAGFDQWVYEKLSVPLGSRDTSNQSEAPPMLDNSSTLVDRTSASDLIGIALNLADLSGSTETDSDSDATSASATVSLYALYSAAAGFNPLEPSRYCDRWSVGTRWLSMTLGFDDEAQGSGETILAGAKLEVPMRWATDECAADAFPEIRERNKKFAAEYANVWAASKDRLYELAKAEAAKPRNDGWPEILKKVKAWESDPNLRKLEREANFSNALSNDDADFQALLAYFPVDEQLAQIYENATGEALQSLDEAVAKAIEAFRNRPRFSVQFLTKQNDDFRNEYEVKGIFDMGIRNGLTLIANGGWERMANMDGGTDDGGMLSTELEFDTAPDKLSGRRGLRFSISGDAKWLDSAPDIYSGLMKVTLPLLEGVDIPLTMKIANRTFSDNDTEVRGGISFSVDTAMLTVLIADLGR